MKKIALIIGAQKSGTTSLFNYLAEHPQVCPSNLKEPFFFADDQRFNQGVEHYLSLWDWQPQHRVGLEASTAYTMSPVYTDVAERIAKVQDIDFYFIYIMRHPLRRIESNVVHTLSTGVLEAPKILPKFISYSRYASQIQPFFETFGPEKLHLLLLEDLKQDPQAELEKIYAFLGLPTHQHHPEKATAHNSRDANHFKVPPYIWKLYQNPMIRAAMAKTPKSFKQIFYRLFANVEPPIFSLSQQEEEDILNTLRSDLRLLKYQYNVDFEKQWNIRIQPEANSELSKAEV